MSKKRKGWRAPAFMAVILPTLAFSQAVPPRQATEPNLPSTKTGGKSDCPSIAGDYDFIGTTDWGGPRSDGMTSLLNVMSRPGRRDVEWFRIAPVHDSHRFTVSFLDASGTPVGGDVVIAARCQDGALEERDHYDGNSDGTRVVGDQTWRYQRDADGTLVVTFSSIGRTYYFPGVPTSRSSRAVSRFRARPGN